MQHNYHNISQTGRRIAGMTQERWAEALDISVESVRLYESGRGMPSDDVATRMVEVSGAPVLGYWHLLNKSRVAADLLPQVDTIALPQAVIQLVRYFLVERGIFQSQLTLISGLVCLALGGFLILRSDIVVRILPIVFGLFVIFDSLGRVQSALELRRCGYGSWKGFLLLALLSVVLGVVMIVDPFGAMETLVMAIGVILIIEGALNLLSALYTMLAVRRFVKLHPEAQSVLEAVTGQDLNGDGVIAPDVARADAEATAVELDHVDESAEVEQENDNEQINE